MSAYLEIRYAHVQMSENPKIAAVIVPHFVRWSFLANSVTYILSGWEKSSIKDKQLIFPLLIFDWRTFARWVTAPWWRQSAKNLQKNMCGWIFEVNSAMYYSAHSRQHWSIFLRSRYLNPAAQKLLTHEKEQ